MSLYALGKDNDENYKIDLRGLVLGSELFESIFSPFIEFNISIIDSLGALRNLPLRGGELLKVKFEIITDIAPSERSYTFRLMSFDKVTQRGNIDYYNPMMFVSKQYFYNLSSRVNWAYPQGTEIKSIISDLTENLMRSKDENKEFKCHETNKLGSSKANQITFTNITPLECIYKMITFTNLKEDNKLSDFLFYECLQEGNKISFNYHSVNKLIKDAKKKWTFKFFPFQNSFYVDDTTKDEKMLSYFREKNIILVNRYEVSDNKNNIKAIENSLAGGAVHSLNLLTKQFRKSEIDAENLHKKGTRINETPWVVQDKKKHFFANPSEDNRPQNSLQQYNIFKVLNYNVFNQDVRDPNTDLIRKFNYNVLDQSQINIEIAGNTDVFLATKTTFEIPEANIESKAGKNKMGKSYESEIVFFITTIRHIFSGRDYKMIINLCADGELNKDIYNRYEKDKKEWVKDSNDQFKGSTKKLPGLE